MSSPTGLWGALSIWHRLQKLQTIECGWNVQPIKVFIINASKLELSYMWIRKWRWNNLWFLYVCHLCWICHWRYGWGAALCSNLRYIMENAAFKRQTSPKAMFVPVPFRTPGRQPAFSPWGRFWSCLHFVGYFFSDAILKRNIIRYTPFYFSHWYEREGFQV